MQKSSNLAADAEGSRIRISANYNLPIGNGRNLIKILRLSFHVNF